MGIVSALYTEGAAFLMNPRIVVGTAMRQSLLMTLKFTVEVDRING